MEVVRESYSLMTLPLRLGRSFSENGRWNCLLIVVLALVGSCLIAMLYKAACCCWRGSCLISMHAGKGTLSMLVRVCAAFWLAQEAELSILSGSLEGSTHVKAAGRRMCALIDIGSRSGGWMLASNVDADGGERLICDSGTLLQSFRCIHNQLHTIFV